MTAHAVREEARLLVLVANERAVEREVRAAEREAKSRVRVETRASFVRRLIETLRPEVRFARVEETRIALGQALVMEAGADVRLSKLAASGGTTWQRTLDALHRSIGRLRASSITLAMLQKIGRAKNGGANAERARTLACALGALDALLQRAGLFDIRAAGTLLAEAIATTAPEDVQMAVGATKVRARGMVQWEGADLGWFRALDAALEQGARIELPTVEATAATLDGARGASPLDVVFDAIGHALDEAPDSAPLDSPLGDLRLMDTPPDAALARIDLRRASDGDAAARAAGDAIRASLDGEDGGAGANRSASLDAVVVAMTRPDRALAASLTRTFAELGIVASFSLATGWGEEAASSAAAGVVGVALAALEIGAHGLDPIAVAALFRSAYLDPQALTGAPDRAPLHRVARAIEETPPMRTETPLDGLAARVARWNEARNQREFARDQESTNVQVDIALTGKLGAILLAPNAARTRAEQVLAARTLFEALGIERRIKRAVARPLNLELPAEAVRASRTTSTANAIARAELDARARDARGWERMTNALDAYEASLVRLGIQHLPATGEVFRHELARILEDLGRGAAAARAGTLRVVLLREVAGEPLDHLIVMDACEGALPPAPTPDPLVPDALEADLAKASPRMVPSHVRRAMDLGQIAAAVASAERTSMIFRARDDEGALAPAPIFAWLERGGVTTTTWGSSPIEGTPRSRHERTLKYMHAASDAARAAFLPEASRRGRIERLREGFFVDPTRTATPLLGKLAFGPEERRALAIESGGGDRPMGVTDLERWAACPFQGFVHVGLRARKRRRMKELPDPRDHGTFVHEALAAAFEATRDEWPLRPRDGERIFARATAAAEKVLTQQGPSSLRELDLVRARASVAIVVRAAIADERWDFLYAERSFGEAAATSWPALVLAVYDADDVVRLRGRLDRLDISHGHEDGALRVVDYKGSGKPASALGDTDLQLPLYAVAAFEALTSRTTAHAAYVAYSTREKPRSEKYEQNFHAQFVETLAVDDQGVRSIVRRSLDILQNARSGSLVPTEGAACTRCDHDGACRKPRFLVPADDKESEAVSNA